jgi:hypothetical protein
VLEQLFFRQQEAVAHALVRARLLSQRGGAVSPRELLALMGLPDQAPQMSDYAARWNSEQAEWKGSR